MTATDGDSRSRVNDGTTRTELNTHLALAGMPDSTLQIPVFPLNSPLVYPGRALPLHIFEPRYRQLMKDALTNDRRFAMAVFRPGWEHDYEGRPPIYPIICIGSIVKYSEFPDGRFLLLLKGDERARIVEEFHGKPYRVARTEPFEDTPLSAEECKNWKLQLDKDVFELCGKRVAPPAEPNCKDEKRAGAIDIAEEAILSLPIPIEKKMCLYSIGGKERRIAAVHQAIRDLIDTRDKLNKAGPQCPSDN